MTKIFSMKLMALPAICLLLFVGQALAQTTGAIAGRVVDPQGAVVANASVKVTNTGTNGSVTITTNGDGEYRAGNLTPGTYMVETTVNGFAPEKADNVIVQVGLTTNSDFKLTLGSAKAVVEVTSEAPVVNTSDNSNTQNDDQTAINERPINGRRWSNFAILSPSAVPDGTFGLISFRGISGLLNNNTIDGGDNNQAFFSEERGRTRINYVISQSAIREFQINTSNYSAEYGRSAGGVTNAVTKSGTNQFHGDGFFYDRDNKWGARNPLQFQSVLVGGVTQRVAVKPPDRRLQWGGTIGGPIVKDKLFFFFSYDQQKRNFPGLAVFTQGNYLNLTPAQVTAITAKGVTAQQVADTQTFVNSLTGLTPRTGDQTLFLPKIDFQINKNNLLTGSYNRLRWKSPAGIQTQAVNNFGRASFGNDFVDVDAVNIRLQSTLSSNMLNEARFQYSRDFEFEFSQPPLPGEPLTGHTALGVRAPDIFLTNGLTFGLPNFLERAKYPDERRLQFADSLTRTMGNHTIKFGADINHVTDDLSNLRNESGGYSYNNLSDFIVDYVHFVSPASPITGCVTSARLAGKCYTSNYVQGIGVYGLKFATMEYNFFGQDDIRVSPRLTVNLGLRWEYIKMPGTPLANNSATIIPFDGRTIADATSHLPNDKNNFGPRIGFAWDIDGNAKTVLRGGFGIYYGRIQNSTISNALINTGNLNGQAQLSLAATAATAPIFPQILANTPANFSNGAIQFFSANFQAPMINQYDLILEHQLGWGLVVSASYIGSMGRALPTFVDYNNVRTGTTTYTTSGNAFGAPVSGTVFTLPFYSRTAASTAAMTGIESTVSSEYNAAVFQIKKRFSKAFGFNASYTLANATDTNQNSATFTQTNSPYDLLDRSYDAGPSNLDVRHKFVASAVWAPIFHKGNDHSGAHYFLNGWQISPILVMYSGRDFDGVVSGTSLNNSFGDARFPLNSRNFFRLPPLKNLDVRISKRFKFAETKALEFLVEGFNVMNRTQVFAENNTLFSRSGNVLTVNPAFGQVTTTDSTLYRERQVQFSARFQF